MPIKYWVLKLPFLFLLNYRICLHCCCLEPGNTTDFLLAFTRCSATNVLLRKCNNNLNCGDNNSEPNMVQLDNKQKKARTMAQFVIRRTLDISIKKMTFFPPTHLDSLHVRTCVCVSTGT